MPSYPVLCGHVGCAHPAEFKIASKWSDGSTQELKTYSLCCQACLPDEYTSATRRHIACRVAHHETLDWPAVFELNRGTRDRQLVRRPELEVAPGQPDDLINHTP